MATVVTYSEERSDVIISRYADDIVIYMQWHGLKRNTGSWLPPKQQYYIQFCSPTELEPIKGLELQVSFQTYHNKLCYGRTLAGGWRPSSGVTAAAVPVCSKHFYTGCPSWLNLLHLTRVKVKDSRAAGLEPSTVWVVNKPPKLVEKKKQVHKFNDFKVISQTFTLKQVNVEPKMFNSNRVSKSSVEI